MRVWTRGRKFVSAEHLVVPYETAVWIVRDHARRADEFERASQASDCGLSGYSCFAATGGDDGLSDALDESRALNRRPWTMIAR